MPSEIINSVELNTDANHINEYFVLIKVHPGDTFELNNLNGIFKVNYFNSLWRHYNRKRCARVCDNFTTSNVVLSGTIDTVGYTYTGGIIPDDCYYLYVLVDDESKTISHIKINGHEVLNSYDYSAYNNERNNVTTENIDEIINNNNNAHSNIDINTVIKNLMVPKTVNGDMLLEVNDAAMMKAEQINIDFKTSVNTNGYDKLWPRGCNINVLPTPMESSKTQNGIQITSSQGNYTISGQATSDTEIIFELKKTIHFPTSSYKILFRNNDTGISIKFYSTSDEEYSITLDETNKVFSGVNGVFTNYCNRIGFIIENNQNVSCTLSPMIVLTTYDSDISFSPWENSSTYETFNELKVINAREMGTFVPLSGSSWNVSGTTMTVSYLGNGKYRIRGKYVSNNGAPKTITINTKPFAIKNLANVYLHNNERIPTYELCIKQGNTYSYGGIPSYPVKILLGNSSTNDLTTLVTNPLDASLVTNSEQIHQIYNRITFTIASVNVDVDFTILPTIIESESDYVFNWTNQINNIYGGTISWNNDGTVQLINKYKIMIVAGSSISSINASSHEAIISRPSDYNTIDGVIWCDKYNLDASQNYYYITNTLRITDYRINSGMTLQQVKDMFDEDPAQIIYTLKEPVIYTLTPTEAITLLKEQNKILSSYGNIELTYYQHLGAVLNEIQTSLAELKAWKEEQEQA